MSVKRYDPFKDSCRDCKNFESTTSTTVLGHCIEKNYDFTTERAMEETASHCWAFYSTGWKATDPDKISTIHAQKLTNDAKVIKKEA